MNKAYPVILKLVARRCLVVGGGPVAARKAESLLAAGAVVTVVSPELSAEMRKLTVADHLKYRERAFRPADVKGSFLVIAAAGDEQVNREAAAAAAAAGVLINVVDAPKLCDFTLPAVLRRGHLLFTVSTGGRSPAAAAYLRRRLAEIFGPEYEDWLRVVGEYRELVLAEIEGKEARAAAFQRLFAFDILAVIKAQENVRAADLAERLFNELNK